MVRSLASVRSLADDVRASDVDLRTFALELPPRYRVVRPLGHGGFGDVMLVHDNARGEEIAMKRLARMDPVSIRRFKHEFRVLQGVRHPSLARLHELFSHRGAWFLAMEHIDGADFLSYVRPGGEASLAPTLPEQHVTDARSSALTFDEARLRSSLAQLASGVYALHRGGIIHRDLKPENVLVDAHERVVILDFGLAATIDHVFHHTAEARLAGTPGYMPPEQAMSQPLTRGADWYAVGVMLYEALTGRKPFVGALRDIVDAQLLGAPDPEHYGHRLPRDLAELCRRLLAPRASERPDGAEILAFLGTPASASHPPELVGRTAELAALDAAIADIATRGPIVLDIVADSGLGKSALVRRAVERARIERGAVVLSTRCYEREALPYKSVDPMMDALTEMLQRRTRDELLAVMPRDARALCRLFPVLESIEMFAKAPELEPIANHEVLRRRAIAALRELLRRVADRAPLVVVLDDLHWGDLDGARLLVDLLSGPDAPRMLLVCAYCHLEPGLRALQRGLAAAGVPRTEMVLAPIPPG
ncbi:MAG: serine/threonine-protein kinase [Kofleriaceae bacterium]|nr:serine/threonine-protein kinase [Kofleriaceae bacterium]